MSAVGGERVTSQQDAPDTGYCVVCGKWGRGRYRGPLNSHSDSIDQHIGCAGDPPDGICSRHVGR